MATKAFDGIERHLRVEVVDDAHRDWPAVRRQMDRAGRADRLLAGADGRGSTRQAVVAAFLCGRPVAHAAFQVAPAGDRRVIARLDSHMVDAPFVGTAVEHFLTAVTDARARTMGCPGPFATTDLSRPLPAAA